MRVLRNTAAPPTCFFCLSILTHTPRDPKSFKCPHCLCWNRYDKAGEIISDEPAMRDESLNTAAFAKRASPSKHRLPTAYGKGPFCHTCETNQMLIINMLSNYLPSLEDSSYDVRVAEMPAYIASLQARYPPVCKDCQPTVDEELRRKEHMARTTALGGWLKQSQQIGTRRSIEMQREKSDVLIWRIRGAMWAGTMVLFISLNLLGFLEHDMVHQWSALLLPYRGMGFLLPLFSLSSFLWTFWDPTWLSARNAHLQGRTFRISGREIYIRCQMIIWLSRIVTSALASLQYYSNLIASVYRRNWHVTALAIEIVLAMLSLATLRIQQPPTVRLMEPRALKTGVSLDPPVSSADPEPLISNLSLSNQSFTSSTNPIFGQPSLAPLTALSDASPDDMMDWAPIQATPERVQDREDWMRPQRFFPPEQPTGLEDLFEKAKLDVEEHVENEKQTRKHDGKEGDELRELGLFFAAAVAVVLVAGLAVYRS